MTLPAWDQAAVQLSDEELEATKRFYNAIRKAQETFADGFQVEDLFKVPEIATDADQTIKWVIAGRPGDPADDEAVAKRIATLGFGLVRASGLFERLGGQPDVSPALPEG